MSGTQAVRAIYSQAPQLLDESAAVRIVLRVAAVDPSETSPSTEKLDNLEVAPALLSLVCRELDQRRKALGRTAIGEEVIAGLSSGNFLADYYQSATADASAPTRRFIEGELVTPSGYRASYALADALQFHGVIEDDVQRLIDRRILSIESRRGTKWIELAHDLFLSEVVRSRDEQGNETRIPESLVAQLADGGRLVVPVGNRYEQQVHIVRKQGDEIVVVTHDLCRFVPLVGAQGWES